MSAMYAWMDIHSLVQMALLLTLTYSLARSTVARRPFSLFLRSLGISHSVAHFATPCDSDILGW